ncbi:hypothetical protein [Streptomyces murinus]|uniref:hypothetical protein n=1 Tax=Streptomyces murinus TaxID=33900 RepID=UPI003727A6CA
MASADLPPAFAHPPPASIQPALVSADPALAFTHPAPAIAHPGLVSVHPDHHPRRAGTVGGAVPRLAVGPSTVRHASTVRLPATFAAGGQGE